MEENQDIISELRAAKQPLYYIIVGEDGIEMREKQQGYYQEMVSLLIEEINLPLLPVEQEEMVSLSEEIEGGNLSFIFGYPLVKEREASFPVNKKENLVLVTRKKDMTVYEVPYAYWGTEEHYRSYIKDTLLEGRTIIFNTGSELFRAVLEGEIEGMLIKHSFYEKYLQERELYLVSEIILPIQEYVLVPKQQDVLLKFMKNFLPFYEKYGKEEQTSTEEVRALESNQSISKKVTIGTAFMLMGLIAFLTLLYFLTQHKRQKERKQVASLLYQELSVLHDSNQEILVVDLLNGKIRSNQHFSCLLRNQKSYLLHARSPHSKMGIKELSNRLGFNFEEHYRYICRQFQRTYLFQYQLYLGGVCYLIKEEGIFEQGVLVLLMSKEIRKE